MANVWKFLESISDEHPLFVCEGGCATIIVHPYDASAVVKFVYGWNAADREGLDACMVRDLGVLRCIRSTPHTVQLRDVVVSPHAFAVVMHRWPASLADAWKEHLSPALLIDNIGRVSVSVLHALKTLHDEDIVHRDVSPGNILVKFARGRVEDACLCDFGLSHRMSDAVLYPYRQIGGATKYVAPEIELCDGGRYGHEHAYDGKVDVWSLGTVICWWLRYTVGSRYALPQSSDARVDTWFKLMIAETPYLASIPNLTDLLDGMVARDPSRRYSASQALEHVFFERLRLRRACQKRPSSMSTLPAPCDVPASSMETCSRSLFDIYVANRFIPGSTPGVFLMAREYLVRCVSYLGVDSIILVACLSLALKVHNNRESVSQTLCNVRLESYDITKLAEAEMAVWSRLDGHVFLKTIASDLRAMHLHQPALTAFLCALAAISPTLLNTSVGAISNGVAELVLFYAQHGSRLTDMNATFGFTARTILHEYTALGKRVALMCNDDSVLDAACYIAKHVHDDERNGNKEESASD